jgi:hypothetical protein
MPIFRNSNIKNAMALFTGLIFLNMSFFLAEVSALKLTQDKKMLENIARLISSSAAEEEKDVFGGIADEDCSAKEVDWIFSYSVHTIHGKGIVIDNKRDSHDPGLMLLGSSEIFSPPPEA